MYDVRVRQRKMAPSELAATLTQGFLGTPLPREEMPTDTRFSPSHRSKETFLCLTESCRIFLMESSPQDVQVASDTSLRAGPFLS